MVYPGTSVYFNDYLLNSIPNLLIQATDVHQMPKRVLEAYKLARSNGESLVSSFFDYREVMLYVAVVAPSRSAFETCRDTLFSVIATPGGRFETPIAGNMRRYYCTMSDNTTFPDFGTQHTTHGGHTYIELHFNAYDPFGYDITATPITMGTTTGVNVNYNFTLAGTWATGPVITATFNTVTATGSQSVTLTNPNTGLAVTISRVWSSSDVLIIDTKTPYVSVNGIGVPWSGSMPVWQPGAGVIQYGDTFSSRNVTLSGSYMKRYL